MSEIIYRFTSENAMIDSIDDHVRWLSVDEYSIFKKHLALCGQKELPQRVWNELYKDGDMYAGFFVDDIMVARAAVEKYSERAWEVADVRTVKEYRNRGYAHQLCKFVLKYICANNILPTIRTEEDNYTMQQIISKLGFTESNV